MFSSCYMGRVPELKRIEIEIDSMTQILFDIGLPSFYTIFVNTVLTVLLNICTR